MDDGLNGAFQDHEAEMYGTLTVGRVGEADTTAAKKSLGLVSNRYLRETYNVGRARMDWWVGQNGYTNTSFINSRKRVAPGSTFEDFWNLAEVSPEYGDEDDMIGVEEKWNGKRYLAATRLCNGKAGDHITSDPKCGRNNNTVDLWITNGGRLPHQGAQIRYSFKDYDENALVIGAPDDDICTDTISFALDQADLNSKLASGRVTTGLSTLTNKSTRYDGQCQVRYSYRVLERTTANSGDVIGVE
nr:hypothetical protein [Streptomyces chartreusis]